MAVDRLGAPFWYRLGDFTGAAGGPSVSERLRGFLAPDPAWPGGMSVAADARNTSFPRKRESSVGRGRGGARNRRP